MKLLFTEEAGYIGSNTILELIKSKYLVGVVDYPCISG